MRDTVGEATLAWNLSQSSYIINLQGTRTEACSVRRGFWSNQHRVRYILDVQKFGVECILMKSRQEGSNVVSANAEIQVNILFIVSIKPITWENLYHRHRPSFTPSLAQLNTEPQPNTCRHAGWDKCTPVVHACVFSLPETPINHLGSSLPPCLFKTTVAI